MSIIFSIGLMNVAKAQGTVSVNINSQPAWGPAGYDKANYYYFPDLNVYFDVSNSLFYYLSDSKWISNRYLPNKYEKDDLYSMYKVVINDSKSPWKENSQHKKEYASFKNNNKQTAIKNSNDSKYQNSKQNTMAWVKKEKQKKEKSNKPQTENIKPEKNRKR